MQQPQAEFSWKPITNLSCKRMGTFSKNKTSPSMALGKSSNFSALSILSSISIWDGQEMVFRLIWEPWSWVQVARICAEGSPREVLWRRVCLCTICQPPPSQAASTSGNKASLNRSYRLIWGLDFLLSPWEYKPSSYWLHPTTLRQQVSLGCSSKPGSCLAFCSKGPTKLTPVPPHVLLFLLMGFPDFLISLCSHSQHSWEIAVWCKHQYFGS